MDCWHREIERATTEDEVVSGARDYLTLWAPRELAPLARDCREVRVENTADIERLKGRALYMAPCSSDMDELAAYLWHASAKIGEIRRSRFRVV